ncbi:hypothetical protein FSB08_12010 [Paraburkholderia sp. JPY432]|nr:hypothetical protein [Paraburkholderia youngii]
MAVRNRRNSSLRSRKPRHNLPDCSPDVARFFADAEALHSYEGTYQMQNLIVGNAITGFSAFI